ncbi:MAG: hypothetical protein K2O34_15180, partial [Acetatifactor sp.]|nr:hypothetical protein [Acetatifactor sp.]
MRLVYDGKAIPLLVENSAFEGVKRIAGRVAEDICKVTGCKPSVASEQLAEGQTRAVLCATVGKSSLTEALEQEGALDLGRVRGRREVFLIQKLTAAQLSQTKAFSGLEELLLICGSDKRGTIYGMFTLSEYIGVS